MVFDSPEKEVIELLEKGPIIKKKLISDISKKLSMTPQGVYKIINKLKDKEVIIENAKILAISAVFIARIREYYLALTKTYYKDDATLTFLPEIKDTSKVSFVFETFKDLNNFWDNAAFLLKKSQKEKRYYCLFEPYSMYFRYSKEQATLFIKHLQSFGYSIVWVSLPAINDTMMADVSEIRSLGVQVVFDEKLDKYIGFNLFDDYMIETTYDSQWMDMMIDFFESGTPRDIVNRVIDNPSKFTLRIYKNTTKQDKIWKRIRKEII